MAFGSVPNCGASGGLSTGLFISDGTDSVLRILATTRETGDVTMHQHGWMQNCCCVSINCRVEIKQNSLGIKEILQDGASFVHLLWHFNLHRK